MGVLLDLDQTLIDSQRAEPFRKPGKWPSARKMIPELLPYEGIPDLLTELRRRGVPIAIVTSSPSSYCNPIVRHWGWIIDAQVCYHDTGSHKPHPAPILKALERLGLQSSEVVSVGDAAKDVVASRRAGVMSIGALWGSLEKEALIQAKPDLLCETVPELTRYLLERY